MKRALRGCGIKISDIATKRRLVIVTTESLGSSCLRMELAKLILANQPVAIKGNAGYSNQSGNQAWKTWLPALGDALAVGAGIWQTERDYDRQQQDLQTQMDIAKMNQDTIFAQLEHEQALQESALKYGATNAGQKGGGGTLMYILIGVALLTVIGVVIASRGKGKSKTTAPAEGAV